jgi:hypothetical protein
MEGAFKNHFYTTNVDYYLIDIRKFTEEQQNVVREAVNTKGVATLNKTFLIQ